MNNEEKKRTKEPGSIIDITITGPIEYEKPGIDILA